MTGRQLALIRGMWGATLLARPTLVLPLFGEPAEAGIGADDIDEPPGDAEAPQAHRDLD